MNSASIHTRGSLPAVPRLSIPPRCALDDEIFDVTGPYPSYLRLELDSTYEANYVMKAYEHYETKGREYDRILAHLPSYRRNRATNRAAVGYVAIAIAAGVRLPLDMEDLGPSGAVLRYVLPGVDIPQLRVEAYEYADRTSNRPRSNNREISVVEEVYMILDIARDYEEARFMANNARVMDKIAWPNIVHGLITGLRRATLDEVADEDFALGLLDALPFQKETSATGLAHVRDFSDVDLPVCPITLEPFSFGSSPEDEAVVFPCGHIISVAGALGWYGTNYTCPFCRVRFRCKRVPKLSGPGFDIAGLDGRILIEMAWEGNRARVP